MKTIDLVNTGEFRELLNLRKLGVGPDRIIKHSDNSVHLLKGINSKNELVIQAIFWTFPKVRLELNKILASNHHSLYSYRYRYLTDPFNAGGGTGATNIQNQASWAAARGGTTATQLLSSPTVLSWRVSAGSWYLIRAHIPFLTSSLSESANVTGMILKLYRTGDFTNTDTCTLHVVPSTQTDPTADPVAADFDNISFSSKGSIAYADIGTGAYEEIAVNTDQISLTGYTKLALIDDRDLNNSAPTDRNDVNFESDTDSNPPLLEVTYTLPDRVGSMLRMYQ